MSKETKNCVVGRMRLGPSFLMGALVFLAGLHAARAGQTVGRAHSAEIAEAVIDLQARYPGAQAYWEGPRVRSVFGRTVATGETAVATAAQFLQAEARVFGVDPGDLRPGLHLTDGRHTQPVMYDRKTGRYRFTLVYYSQYSQGLPVFRSNLRILVRNEPGFPVVLVNSSLHDLGGLEVPEVAPVLRPELAEAAAGIAVPGLTDFSPPRTVIWAGVNDMVVEPAVALEFVGTSTAPQRRLFIADAITGDILYQENRIITVDVTGHVGGLATEGTAPEHCEAEVMTAMPYARVTIDDGNSAFADVNGNFVIPHDGIDEVTVRSPIRGEWFRVFNAGGDDTELPLTVTPPGPADFIHNESNTELERAQVNGYVHANVIRDFVLAYNPDYPTLDQTEFSVNVNRTDGVCPGNAWYDDEPGINFCLAEEEHPNTAWSSVVYHEYGHHLVNAAGSGQGEYGEGMSDTMSVLITGESGVAFGFFGDCNAPLRDADNDMQYPCEGGSHECGQLLSGCVWSTRNELELTHPSDYMEIVASLAVNAMLLHSGWSITPQITIDYLTLDDDDDSIGNGTPHRSEICAGFGAHNMDCPDLVPLEFTYPDGRPEVAAPGQSTSFPVDVTESASAPVPGTGNLHYSLNDDPFLTVPMDESSPNHYEAALPAADCGTRVEWYVSVQETGGSTITDPMDAPDSTYTTNAAAEMVVVLHDTFETDQGWVVQDSDTLTDGTWERDIPRDCNEGDPPSDFDGSGQCYLTDNASALFCIGNVDGGYTWLISPTLDLSFGDARVHYALWYTNFSGGYTHSDVFKVHVSNNDGANWTLVEAIGPITSSGWTEHSFIVGDFVIPTSEVKVRFEASDLGDSSTVEAGVDDFEVSMFLCTRPPTPEPGGPLCGVAADCAGAYEGADCVAGQCYVPKNRYLSIDPAVNWPPVAYQVELTEAADYPTAVGRTWWLDEPQCYDYPNGDVVVPPPTSCEGSERFGWVSKLTSTPVTRVWTEVPVHISDCGIVPAVIYEIRASEDDGASLSAEALEIGTSPNPEGDTQSWGDITGGPVEGMPGLWLPPERATNLADVQYAIRTFENRSEDTGFPPRVWVDVEINQVINLGDVQFIVSAFEGKAYVDIQLDLIGVNPADCP